MFSGILGYSLGFQSSAGLGQSERMVDTDGLRGMSEQELASDRQTAYCRALKSQGATYLEDRKWTPNQIKLFEKSWEDGTPLSDTETPTVMPPSYRSDKLKARYIVWALIGTILIIFKLMEL